ncbi:uncharacterized protein [Diadema setosum]|uniref:uncharacterized protein n=1 Tax=Diadema setosum TaxID=31175 RepID=UPI003B3BDB73
MPITKVPVVHKFGIISQSQRDELQARLLQQSVLQTRTTNIPQTTRNPLELSETFIQQFNNPVSIEEKDKNEDTALKLLARIKRRAGLKGGGVGSHVDIPRAWSELSMLAQCRGKVQEECLDMLIVSLRQAEFSVDHIPSLFYLAETTLYWLRTDAMDQPFLRIGEIKLLKMGQAVFLRLFYHHMAGHLQGRSDFKTRLLTYLSGFAENEEAYNPYPGAHLCLRLIASIGKMIVGEVVMNELKRQSVDIGTDVSASEHKVDNLPAANNKPESHFPSSPPNTIAHSAHGSRDTPMAKQPPFQQAQSSTQRNAHLQSGLSPQHTPVTQQPQAPLRPDTYTSSIHDLSPSLWHALDVWRCTVHLSAGFPEALKALALCGTTLGSEHWVDAVVALRIISEAAKGNMKVMQTLQNLAKGVVPGATVSSRGSSSAQSTSSASQTRPLSGRQSEDEPGLADPEDLDDGSEMSLKECLSDTQSVEIKLNDMLDSKMEMRVDSKTKKSGMESELSLGPKQFSNLSSNSLLKSTSLRNASVAVMIDSPQDKRAASLSDRSTVLKGSGSSVHSIPDVSSRESQLDSAGALLANRIHSRSPVMEEDEDDVDSDLAPGDESYIEINREDVTNCYSVPEQSQEPENDDDIAMPELRTRREVSFDMNIVEETMTGEDIFQDRKARADTKQPGKEATRPWQGSVIQEDVSNKSKSKGVGMSSRKQTPLTRRLKAKSLVTELDGINAWSWEVAFAYTDLMGQLCLHGNTANIQKRALVGDRLPDYRTAPSASAYKLGGLTSAGLLDMAEFEGSKEDDLGLRENWSWRVRYAAVLALVTICRCCEGDTAKEGLRTVAWNFLMIRHSREKDDRVMEAFRVGQVDAHLESAMQKNPALHNLNSRLAAGLATTYLPPLTPAVSQPKRPQYPKVDLPKPAEPLRKGPNRLSLRQEIQLATALQDQLTPQADFYSRTSMDLKRIVEDQWRKELQEQLEEEERGKREYLEEQQAMVEKKQREVADHKASKFKSTTPQP